MNNVQKVQKIYSDFGNGNVAGIVDVLADDITWIDAGYPDLPFAPKSRTKKEVPDFFKALSDGISYTKFETREFISDGNKVIAIGYHEGSTKPTDTKFGHEWIMVWKFNDAGKVNYYKSFIDTNEIAKGFRN